MKKILFCLVGVLCSVPVCAKNNFDCTSSKIYPFTKEECALCPDRTFKHSRDNIGYCLPKDFTCPDGKFVTVGWSNKMKGSIEQLDYYEEYEEFLECTDCSEKRAISNETMLNILPTDVSVLINCSGCPNREEIRFLDANGDDPEGLFFDIKICALKECPTDFCFDKEHNCIDKTKSAEQCTEEFEMRYDVEGVLVGELE